MGGIFRAFVAFSRTSQLNKMRETAMARSFSWAQPAASYGDLYRDLAAHGCIPAPAVSPLE
jgi:starch synthase